MMTRRTLSVLTKAAIVAGIFTVTGPYPPAFASPLGITRAAIEADDGMVLEVRFRGGGARVGHSALGNRNVNVNRNVNANRNVNVNRNVSVNRNVVRNRTVVNRNVVRTAWVRPGYLWRPGGAIVAGAAIGFVSAATAAAWAGAAPEPGLCWYYTDQVRTQGFWDECP